MGIKNHNFMQIAKKFTQNKLIGRKLLYTVINVRILHFSSLFGWLNFSHELFATFQHIRNHIQIPRFFIPILNCCKKIFGRYLHFFKKPEPHETPLKTQKLCCKSIFVEFNIASIACFMHNFVKKDNSLHFNLQTPMQKIFLRKIV